MFNPNRLLLNPKFEGYRFDPLDQSNLVFRYDLACGPSQTAFAGNAHLSFQEVQSRIRHNHLTTSSDGTRALYIDAEYRLVLIELDASDVPCVRTIHQLPIPIQTVAAGNLPINEYPSASFASHDLVFVSDGSGHLWAINILDNGTWESHGPFTLPQSSLGAYSARPFRIHYTILSSTPESAAALVLSSKSYGITSSQKVLFDIWVARLDWPLASSSVVEMKVAWHGQGTDVPISVFHDHHRHIFGIVGETVYQDPSPPIASSPEPDAGKSSNHPRENITITAAQDERPPPYSWTQTSDSITVAFPLPSSTPKSNIKIFLNTHSLSLRIDNASDTDAILPLPHYSMKRFWDTIQPSSSFWTWDRQAEKLFGLLTLHLEKQHEGTKWSHVFASSGTTVSGEANPEDAEVPETLDPSELWEVREALEKYTASLIEGKDTSGLGLGSGVPKVAKGETDDEIDPLIGRDACVTWIGDDGREPEWSRRLGNPPITLISTMLPGLTAIHSPSLIIKNGLDGTVFDLDQSLTSTAPPSWIHSSTFSALAFVLASKQDTRFTYHTTGSDPRSCAVLAFESSSRHGGGNLYIYRGSSQQDLSAKQAVIKILDGLRAGALLGVGAMKSRGKTPILVCLCEHELVLVKDIL